MDSSRFFAYPDVVSRQATGFLSNLHEDDVAIVLGYTQARRYAGDEFAVREGESDRAIYIVTAGRFEVVMHTARGLQQIGILQPGDIFGELAFFDSQPRSAGVRALEGSEALILTPAGFDQLRLTEPRLALAFVLDLGRILSQRLRFRESNPLRAPLGRL